MEVGHALVGVAWLQQGLGGPPLVGLEGERVNRGTH